MTDPSQQGVQLTLGAAQRTEKAVHTVEGLGTNAAGALGAEAIRGHMFWAQITGSAGAIAPFQYSWVEQYDAAGGLAVYPPASGGRYGSAAGPIPGGDMGPAVNAWEQSPAGAGSTEPIPLGTYVWIENTYDASAPPRPVWRFFVNREPLSVGVFCYGPKRNYDDHGDITEISFQRDMFTVHRDPDPVQSSRALIYWNGFTVTVGPGYSGSATVCGVQIIDLHDFGDSGFNTDPAVTNSQNTAASSCQDQYGVFWDVQRPMEPDPCRTCNDPPLKQSVGLSARVYIDACRYRSTVVDCASHSTSCIDTFTFGNGFTVGATPKDHCTLGKARIDLNLTVGTGSAYANFGPVSACDYKLNLCTETKTFVTEVVCNGDGTITVTTDTIVGLAPC